MHDKFEDECGVFGIFGHPEAANLTYLGLYALQHRGQESCGIVSSDGNRLRAHKGMGLVADVFKNDAVFDNLPGASAIGHVRYSTAGGNDLKNCQPINVDYHRGAIAVAHNGNLVNAQELRNELELKGSIFSTIADTEVIIHLMARAQRETLAERVTEALNEVKGAYSLVFLTETRMVAVRDPNGFRPLALGKLDGAYVVASETCAFDLIEAQFIREIEPGEMIVIDKTGLTSLHPFAKVAPSPCIFEYIYFSRPDSTIFGREVYGVRKEFGHQLAREHAVEADVVIAIPDSGVPAAIGYAEESGIPFQLGLIRNHYVGRTFIEPQQAIRHFGVKIKLNPVREIIEGKRVVVVDDSIVRGTTARKIIKMIRNAGAKEIHMRISCPPTSFPCYYGINTPTRKELISSSHSIEEINRYITSDTLGYLSLEGLRTSAGVPEGSAGYFCDACFSGHYPVKFPRLKSDSQLGLF
ncbi:amidophosphoribosyltransferase [Desulfuromonas soudanensis]|uniref:Amidophosphoribosyltransferase n=1 Tax=Desulfuromonas soudanensis TaxID=1603606 RepID=A0A0M3QFN9_9BACT|nr:amidophosphoribosyltransferase [Desulfuromonas soudanensis]ALC16559.1 amidophosphoribosyltransferase [Desulfuromonas soudanensis]